MDEPKKVRRTLKTSFDPGRKYDEILKQQEALNEHIKEIGHEGYQRLFVKKSKGMGTSSWVMIIVIIVSVIALIVSLPINWG